MKPIRYLALIALLLTVSAPAQADYQIKLAADSSADGCAVTAAPLFFSVYAFLWGGGDSSVKALQFAAVKPACMSGATLISEIVPANPIAVAPLGSTQAPEGLSILFSECQTLPHVPNGLLLVEMRFLLTGVVPSCCAFSPTHPTNWLDYATPGKAIDCNNNEFLLGGSHVMVNPDATCPCDAPLAVESSTWGKVKSLYK